MVPAAKYMKMTSTNRNTAMRTMRMRSSPRCSMRGIRAGPMGMAYSPSPDGAAGAASAAVASAALAASAAARAARSAS